MGFHSLGAPECHPSACSSGLYEPYQLRSAPLVDSKTHNTRQIHVPANWTSLRNHQPHTPYQRYRPNVRPTEFTQPIWQLRLSGTPAEDIYIIYYRSCLRVHTISLLLKIAHNLIPASWKTLEPLTPTVFPGETNTPMTQFQLIKRSHICIMILLRIVNPSPNRTSLSLFPCDPSVPYPHSTLMSISIQN